MTRMTLLMLTVSGALTVGRTAHAQAEVLPFVVPPAVVSMAMEAWSLASLAQDGTVRRGVGINSVVFGSVSLGISVLLLALTSTSVTKDPTYWQVGCGTGMAVGASAVLVGIYDLLHPPAPPPHERLGAVSTRDEGTGELGPPQTASGPQSVRVAPLTIASRAGIALGGAVSFRW